MANVVASGTIATETNHRSVTPAVNNVRRSLNGYTHSGVGTSGKAPRSIEAISATSLLTIIKATIKAISIRKLGNFF